MSLVFFSDVGVGIVRASEVNGSTAVQVAQQPDDASTEPNRAAAEQVFNEGWELYQQGTAESLPQAIPKFEQAAILYRQAGDKDSEALSLLVLGRVYDDLGEKQKALEFYNQALPLYQAVGDRGGEAITLNNLGGVYDDLGEKQKALEFYNQALPLYQAVGDRRGEATTLNNLGAVYNSLGEKQKALEFYNQALPLLRAVGDRGGEARTLSNIGLVYSDLGEKQKALEFYNQALPLRRVVGDRGGEATTLSNIGLVYSDLGEKQKALEFYNQALPLRRAVGDRGGEAVTLSNIGLVYSDLGENQKALEFYNQALPLRRAVGDRGGEAATLSNIGLVYSDLGEKQKALEFYNQALPLLRAVGDRGGEATTLSNIGAVYNSLGEKQKALEFYNQALPLRRAVGDRRGEAVTLNNLGGVYDDLGERQKALEYYNQALPLRRAVGDRGGEATTLSNIGGVYDDLGERQKALEYYNQALPLRRAVGDRGGEAITLSNIGRVYDSLGEKQKALEFYNQALSLLRAVGDRGGEAVTLSNLGGVYDSLGKKQKALEFYNQALPLRRVVGDRGGEATTLSNIGAVYNSLGEKQKALEFYNQALPLSRAVGDREGEATTLSNVASLQRSQGNLKEALTLMENSITIIEDLRTKIGSQELRTSYFATVQGDYQFYIDLLMQLHQENPNQGYDALALHASERSRARSLLELLTEANADIRQGVEPQLVEQERTLQQKLDAIEKRRVELLSGNHTPQQATAIEQEREQLLSQYRDIQTKIRTTSPRYAALTQPEPLTLAEIQQQILDEDTLLLQYSLGSERSYLWAVSKTSINSYKLPPREEIEAAAKQFYELLKTPGFQLEDTRGSIRVENVKANKAVSQLSEMLLTPVAEQLGNKRLLIVGDGALQYIPFAALPVPGTSGEDGDCVPSARGKGLVGAGLFRFRQAGESFGEPAPTRDEQGLDESQLPHAIGLVGAGFSISQPAGEILAKPALTADKPAPTACNEETKIIPLLANNEIVNLPSATTLGIIRQEQATRKTAPKAIAILADPVFSSDDERVTNNKQKSDRSLSQQILDRSAREADIGVWRRLPGTRTEAEAIMALVPDSERVQGFDFAANRQMITNPELSNYRIIHLATHGLLNSINPELSGVVLSLFDEQGNSQNGFLRLHDVFNLNLPAELVVLSACQTGLGQEVKGEGLVGLTRGFMYAGSPRVLVSLWNVSDAATAEMMKRFYRKMLEEGLSATAALRTAQLEMQQETQWKAPYYWAAFTLQGEWK
ncbi:MAG: tetratricopeptide repeat protein [Symploca sp. SIO2C1]|nr:tetratricopeptide repeat protein [Symploca sp. SIO2C1]